MAAVLSLLVSSGTELAVTVIGMAVSPSKRRDRETCPASSRAAYTGLLYRTVTSGGGGEGREGKGKGEPRGRRGEGGYVS